MPTRPFGTITHRSFAYVLLLVAAGAVGLVASVLLRILVGPMAEGLGASDAAHGDLTILALAPVPVALVLGRRVIRRLWTVAPAPARRR